MAGKTGKVPAVPGTDSAVSVLKPKEEGRGHTPVASGRDASAL